MFLENCEVTANINIAGNMFLMKLKGDKSISKTKPGQFFMIQPKNGRFFLRRPISIHYVDENKNELEFYYEIKGHGTNDLACVKEKDIINVQGPLGNGFDTHIKGKNVMVVGGGMGIAPMKYLIENLIKKENRVTFIAGGRNKATLKVLSNMSLEGVTLCLTTDDGSKGSKGRVDGKLKELVKNNTYDVIFTCGPEKMMESVANIAHENDIECQVSLEARMACGVKACVGCSIKTKVGMRKVCHDGPVFDSKIIVDMNPEEKTETCCGN